MATFRSFARLGSYNRKHHALASTPLWPQPSSLSSPSVWWEPISRASGSPEMCVSMWRLSGHSCNLRSSHHDWWPWWLQPRDLNSDTKFSLIGWWLISCFDLWELRQPFSTASFPVLLSQQSVYWGPFPVLGCPLWLFLNFLCDRLASYFGSTTGLVGMTNRIISFAMAGQPKNLSQVYFVM